MLHATAGKGEENSKNTYFIQLFDYPVARLALDRVPLLSGAAGARSSGVRQRAKQQQQQAQRPEQLNGCTVLADRS